MAEEQNDNGRKISVCFSRKVSDGNYGSIEATAWVQGDAEPDATAGKVSLLLGDLFAAAKVAVLDQLGIAYEMDAETGIVRENVQPTVQSAIAAVERAFPNTTVHSASDSSDIKVMNPDESTGPLPDWLVRDCNKLGITAVWDKRAQAAGTKQPHFKEAVARGGTGHGKDGEAKAWWPPRN